MISLTELVSQGTITSASGDIITPESMARSLGMFKRYGTESPSNYNIVIKSEWAHIYRSNNMIWYRMKHAWAVLTGKAVAFELS